MFEQVIEPEAGAGIVPTQKGVGETPGYAAIDARRLALASLQQGALSENSYKARQRAAGANMSVEVLTDEELVVEGTTENAQGNYVVAPHKEIITATIEAANATNPRIDQIVVRCYDTAIDSSGKNAAVLQVLKGTASAGATLSNHEGAASLPASTIRLAYILVPAAAVSITTADIEKVVGVCPSRIETNLAAGIVGRSVNTPYVPSLTKTTLVMLSFNPGGTTLWELAIGGTVQAKGTVLNGQGISFLCPPGATWEFIAHGEFAAVSSSYPMSF